MILQQKMARFLNYETSRRNPDSSFGIYLTAAKVAQYRLVVENRKEKEEKKGNRKEDIHPKFVP